MGKLRSSEGRGLTAPLATGRTPGCGAFYEVLLTYFWEILVSVISVCKILVCRLENIVTSEMSRGDLGDKLNSITSRKE